VLEAVQFPMAAHMDFEMVVRTIIKSRVNVILGMPSYILQLFDKGDALLAGYRGIEKIFYGGEHFSETQKKHLKDRYGVRLIRSGAYGSVDIGPIGFQCGHCEGGVHHLQQRLQYLEILKLHEDRPVVGEEVGRLIFTPRALDSGKPLRYEIGDVGNWVSETGCPCGRSSPRFKLLGRMGDIFRIGSMFLNYQKFAQLLSSEAGYSGEVQVVLGEESLREKVTLLVSDGDSEALRRLCLENYPDLNEAVLKDGVLLFEIKKTSPDGFERTKGSGKLVRVIDRRQRA
jgi:phenylacetate-coenzyme A ligase PaaK-like adenylate-forming protein